MNHSCVSCLGLGLAEVLILNVKHFNGLHVVYVGSVQDKIDAVERLKRVEAFNREKQLQKIEDDNRRLAQMAHSKYLLQQEKIKVRKEQVLRAAPHFNDFWAVGDTRKKQCVQNCPCLVRLVSMASLKVASVYRGRT